MNSKDICEEDMDIFISDISEASEHSDKDKSFYPPVTGNNQPDTDLDTECCKSGYSWKIKQFLGYFSIYYFCVFYIFFIIFYNFSLEIASVTLLTISLLLNVDR